MTKSVQAVERACDLMFLIASNRSGLGVTEIASELGLSKSAVHRLLVALGNKLVVQQNPQSYQYHLHPRVLELALPFLNQSDIFVVARPFLDSLRDQFQETAVLGLRAGFSCRLVTHSPSPHELRFIPTIGRRIALHWGAFGKAILAGLSEEEFAAFLRNAPLVAVTPQTIVDLDRLCDELRQIRKQGFATSISEVLVGNVGVAACICDHNDAPVGCIGLGGPELRLREFDLEEVGHEVAEVARQMSTILHLQGLTVPVGET